jgi:hypothetical protein
VKIEEETLIGKRKRILWHVGPLRGNDREMSKNITAITEYRLCKQGTMERQYLETAAE